MPFPLHEKQRSFLALTQLEALYGGAAGGGKTEALLGDALRPEFIREKRYSCLILRRTYPELAMRGSIMQRAIEWVGDEYWDGNLKRFALPSGAVIQFGYCDNERDLGRYKSAQFHRVYIDELTEWPEDWYAFLFSRIRKSNFDSIPLAMRAATNPDGPGADWVRARFGIPLNEVVVDPILSESTAFLPARVEDNPSLNLAEYEASLAKLGPTRYAQLRWGRWSRDGEGLVYRGFKSERNTLRELPEGFIGYGLALDYGFNDECAFAIFAWRRYSKIVYIVSCYKKGHMSPGKAAEEVYSLEEEYEFEWIVGDTGGLGKGYQAEALDRFKLPIEPAQKTNKMGYIKLMNGDFEGDYLAERGPQILVFSPMCEDLLKEYGSLDWAKNRIGRQENQSSPNHCSDAALYGWRRCFAYLAEQEEKEKTQAEKDEAEVARMLEAQQTGDKTLLEELEGAGEST